ncbi:MAG TPA: polysaccharide biosynthesis protein [Methylococcaceae bacterium]|nr:polysaccharide biosynthesis protein [Methylococcaceae bacterium]
MLKKLASQTAIYGLSSIVGRFINYLLVPLYTYYFTAAEYGVVSEFYAYSGFLSVFLLLGFETGYFRFHQDHPKAYSTALGFVLLVNISVAVLCFVFNQAISSALHYSAHREYVICFALILTFDALAALPFAKLRAENRALRFASIKLIEILLTVALSLFFIVLCPLLKKQNITWLALIYREEIGIGYIFLANLLASASKFLFLAPQFGAICRGFDWSLFKRMVAYSLPMVIISFAGIVNEMLDRALLKYFLPYDNETNLAQLGIYSACYKLSILMTLFIQAFRYAAEPFFFSYAKNSDAKRVYAQVLRYFTIFCVFIFLLVTLYLDFFKYFIGAAFRSGLKVVPILLLANLFLGIYVNLSIWYKLSDRTAMGAGVSLLGAGLTVILNFYWIPWLGYMGSAYATLVCYAVMAGVSYVLGQIYYPVAYHIKAVIGYLLFGVGLYFASIVLQPLLAWQSGCLASALMVLYTLVTLLFERYHLRHQRLTLQGQP